MGVVGELQLDVLESRMKSEYNVEYRKYAQPYQFIKKVPAGVNVSDLKLYEVKWVQDFRDGNYLLFPTQWHINYTLEHNEGLTLEEYGSVED